MINYAALRRRRQQQQAKLKLRKDAFKPVANDGKPMHPHQATIAQEVVRHYQPPKKVDQHTMIVVDKQQPGMFAAPPLIAAPPIIEAEPLLDADALLPQAAKKQPADLVGRIKHDLRHASLNHHPAILQSEDGNSYAIRSQMSEGGMGALYNSTTVKGVNLPTGVRKRVADALMSPTIITEIQQGDIDVTDYLSTKGVARLYDRFSQESNQGRTMIDIRMSQDDKRNYVKAQVQKLLPHQLSAIVGGQLDDWDLLRLYRDLQSIGHIKESTEARTSIDTAVNEALRSPNNTEGALKVARTVDPTIAKSIEAEIGAIRAIGTSQYLVQILNAGHEDKTGSFFIFYKKVHGQDLHKWKNRYIDAGQLPNVERVGHLMNLCAQGLLTVHDRKLAHRDIKPANIMFSVEEGIPVIVDLGAALLQKMMGLRNDQIIGTPMYMAPDMINANSVETNPHDRLKQEQANDVYALGATIYELLTGEHPFEDHVGREAMQYAVWKITASDPKTYALLKPHQLCPDIPRPLSELVNRCLAPDWRQRPSIQEVEAATKAGLLYDGLIPNGISMRSQIAAYKHAEPGRYTAADLKKDVREHPELRDLTQLCLASYRNNAYESEGLHEQELEDWGAIVSRTKDESKKKTIEQRYGKNINYSLERVIRTIPQAIGEQLGKILFDVYRQRYADPAYAARKQEIRAVLSDADTANPGQTFRSFRDKIVVPELAAKAAADGKKYIDGKGVDTSATVFRNKANRLLLNTYYGAIETHPAWSDLEDE